MSDVGKCANCARVTDGPEQKFCPACGQPTPAHRIDWHFLGHELEHSVLHMDRGLLYSLKELMLRPGHLMRAYLEGRRAKQAKPLLLIMIMAAVVVFLSKYMLGGGVMDGFAATGAQGVAQGGGDAAAYQALIVKASTLVAGWMNQYFAVSTLLLLPLEAAAFRLSFHRAGGLNYPEWLVITAFLTVQTFVLWVVLMLLHRWVPHAMLWVTAIAVPYGIFSLIQFFQGYPWWKSLLRALLGFGIFFVVSGVLTQVLVMGLALLMHR